MKIRLYRGEAFRISSLSQIGYSSVILQRSLAALILLFASSVANAVQFNCSDYPQINGFHVIDGDPSLPATIPASVPAPDNIKIDVNCRIQNYSRDDYPSGINTNFSFDNNDTTPYLVVFNNVDHVGNMSCNTVAEHKIFFTNGSSSKILGGSCQNLLIPVEMIDKRAEDGDGNEIQSATIGVPFTYSLDAPVLFDAGSGSVINDTGSLNDISKVQIQDDISFAALGVDLSYLSHSVRFKSPGGSISAPLTEGVDYSFSFVNDVLSFFNFSPEVIPAGAQYLIDVEVRLDDTINNQPGDSFTNIATWEFAREIDGIFYDPLPGENGRAELVTISDPALVLDKSSDATAVNFTDTPLYMLDIQNVGGFPAWNITVEDSLPVGMCAADPTASITAEILQSDFTVIRTLNSASDLTINYGAEPCLLVITLEDSAGSVDPSQYLRITYNSQLDPIGSADVPADGDTLTNVAAATEWYNDDSANATRLRYSGVRTDGTPGVADNQDSYTVTAGLSGYYFEKTAANLTTGVSPTASANPGDQLSYEIRLFNLDQELNSITITDQLDMNFFAAGTPVVTTCPTGASCSFDGSGLLTVTGSGGDLDVVPLSSGGSGTSEVVIEFSATLQPGLVSGSVLANQADLSATDNGDNPVAAQSDDPNVNGVRDASDPSSPPADTTDVTIEVPAPLSKVLNPALANVVIGQTVTYRVTVPEVAGSTPLHDVRILDDLSASGVDLHFVSATVVSGGSWSLTNTGSASNLVIEDLSTGIDIPAGSQAIIDITVEVLNTIDNQQGDTFSNTASYTFNRANGNNALRVAAPAGPNDTSSSLTLVEPTLAITKGVINVTPGKGFADPAAGGDILQYNLLMPNEGSSPAFDSTVTDTLPAGLTFIPGSANAFLGTIGSAGQTPIAGFIPEPTEAGDGVLIWGDDNGDGSLDVPVGQYLLLTYRVNVTDASTSTLVNSAVVDWTSLNGFSGSERSGSGCPDIVAPDDYCTVVPAQASISVVDTTLFAKSVVADSWDDSYSSANDSVLRVGDTLDYQLVLTLREGITRNVVVSDALPSGLVFDSVLAINGEALAPYNAVAPFAHSAISSPTVDAATNTVTWNIGDVENASNNDISDDSFVILYRARAASDTLPHSATTTLTNNARFTYDSGTALTASADAEIRQPILVTLTKTDELGNSFPDQAAPRDVDIGSEVMQFSLQACNDGGSTAPAYSLQLVDTLASELDETSLSTPVVTVDGVLQDDGVGYVYTPPAIRGGDLTFDLIAPVSPGQCARVEYSIGFHTDVEPDQVWNNSVTAAEYWSLPLSSGQQFAALGPAEYWMTNSFLDPLPLKTLVSPATEARIGEEVVYAITIPAANALRSNVVVTDSLPAALVYDSASAVVGGSPVTVTDNSTAPGQVSLTIAEIPAGQEAVITLVAHVANSSATNAGNTFNNTAAYSYDGYSGAALVSAPAATLTIVEPLVNVAKSVSPTDPAVAGDILTYTVTMAADSGANFSEAFDLILSDSLTLGLAYVPGTASLSGVPVEPAIAGDGVSSPQTLTWSGIDIPEGTTVTAVYDVRVQNTVTPGQVLANVATARWTSLSGSSANERDGSGGINDYVSSDSTNVGAPDLTNLTKSRLSDTFNTSSNDLRVGDRVQFELRVGLQEGTHNDLVLTDTLPAGLAFEVVVSAVFFGASGSATPVVNGQTLTWDFGTQINPADGDASNDFIALVYEARILNNDALAQTPTQQPLFNNAALNYTIGGVAAPTKTASSQVTVLQPELSVSKSVDAGGDGQVTAGESVAYTVDITNSGDAPAYDALLEDTLPLGMRDNGVTTQSISLLSGASLPVFAPDVSNYQSTGAVSWDFDSGAADTYTIPAGDTLRIVYTVQADDDLGAGLTLQNLALVASYYSFDDESVPTNGSDAEREQYGPTNTASASLSTPTPDALQKVESVSIAAIGDRFTYRIIVPATPAETALFDVHIIDDLGASAAALAFVQVDRAPTTASVNTGAWTPVNIGDATQVDIADSTNGIDIPAGEQIAVDITVELLDAPANIAGLVFSNTADYSYNSIDNDIASEAAGAPGTSGDTTIVEPALVLTKTGPDVISVGTPEVFTLEVQNTGSSAAWDITLTDHLPNLPSGGMCDNQPQIVSAQVIAPDGATVVATLIENTDFVTVYSTPCIYTFVGQSPLAALEVGQFLRVQYQAELDTDTPAYAQLTNYAGATEWFSADDFSAARRSYTHTLLDEQEENADPQDYHTLASNPPVIRVEKTVALQNDVNGDGVANPGDTLRYTVTVINDSQVLLPDFSLIDDLGALNNEIVFEAGSLFMEAGSVPPGATNNSSALGGTNQAGLVNIQNLSLGAQGTPEGIVNVYFDVTLAAVIDNGTVVFNQGRVDAFGETLQLSDDPALAGDEDPTEIMISSAPVIQVQKISDDITGAVNVLASGDTLRYTITVWNTGDENAVDVRLKDAIPEFSTYVANSTTLNGNNVADPAPGVSPLVNDLLINSFGNSNAGALDANPSASPDGIATITFSVTINANTLTGTRIVNQGFVQGSGAGGTTFIEQPSDDPATSVADDPTVDVVGDVPLLDVQKTVQLSGDQNSNNAPDPDDTLLYTFVISNTSANPASSVELTDSIPVNTSYVPNSTTLNGLALADVAATSPLESGIAINSAGEVSGRMAGNSTATVTFQVTINSAVAGGTLISNQGVLTSNEQADEPSDVDGIDSNGDQPTQIIVGSAQQLAIVKSVAVVGGGTVQAGSELEYSVQVSNTGAAPLTQLVLTDDLNNLVGLATYVDGSAQLNGASAGITLAAGVLTANYGNAYGELPVGATATLRFRVVIEDAVAAGTTITNTANASWDNATRTASSTVSVEVGAIPGTATLSGRGWHDHNFDNTFDASEQALSNWTVALFRNGIQLLTTNLDDEGYYEFSGLPETQLNEAYEIRFSAPQASANTAKLGLADSNFTNELQAIKDITANSGSLVANLNLPIDPNGVVYNSLSREAVAGARLTLLNGGGSAVDSSCFDDPAQQGQVTTTSGFYKFDLNFSNASCSSGSNYLIEVVPPANSGYEPGVSSFIAPASTGDTAAYDVPDCTDDAVVGTAACESQASASQPLQSVAPNSPETRYYLHMAFSAVAIPEDSQIFNNHIPLDPTLTGAVSISKTAAVVNVSRGQFVPYAIRISNNFGPPIPDLTIVDSYPAGFKYVADSARLDGQPVVLESVGRQLILRDLDLAIDGEHTLKMLFIVGAGVSEGEYINRAQVVHTTTSGEDRGVSGEATAAVRVVPDPDFDCTDVIGKIFDDANLNGYQDEGEAGLPGVRAVTARGLVITSDQHGRFHITCAVVPDENRGSNFILKVDDRTLPSGYRLTTENPLVQRATRGKMVKFNFGAALHRVVRLDIADGVFQPGSEQMRMQWASRLPLLMKQLQVDSSLLRLSYMAEVEDSKLVEQRLEAVKSLIKQQWAEIGNPYELVVETEVFWRTGAPSQRSSNP